MNQKSEEGLFDVLEKILKAAEHPMDAVELYNNFSEIRERASNPNRVSDYLGNMWRAPKNLLVRLPAPQGQDRKTRWLYAWKGKKQEPRPSMQDAMEKGIAYDPQIDVLLNKPNLHIERDGKLVTIVMPNLRITIEQIENQ